jgi:hypothetical protein
MDSREISLPATVGIVFVAGQGDFLMNNFYHPAILDSF